MNAADLSVLRAFARRDRAFSCALAREIIKESPALLRELRQTAGFTQAEIADVLHVSQPQITAYESGKSLPRSSTGADLVALLVASVDLVAFGFDGEVAATLRHAFPPPIYTLPRLLEKRSAR